MITGSIQYVDVGIKLEVEPQVYVDNDVGIKINLEVSNIAKTVETASGIAYQIGTRSAQTSLRLRDGGDAGAGRPDQRPGPQHREQGAGGSAKPIAGKLFSTKGDATKSEIVLSITPRIVRPQTLPEARSGDVWSGTESVVREKPLRLDPIGAAKAGNVAEMPALAPSGGSGPCGRAPTGHRAEGRRCGAAASWRQPCGRRQRVGAGRRSQCRADCGSHRREVRLSAGGAGTGASAGRYRVYGGTGSSSPPPAPTNQRAPASIQPAAQWRHGGTAAGRHPPPAPPAAPRRARKAEDGRHATQPTRFHADRAGRDARALLGVLAMLAAPMTEAAVQRAAPRTGAARWDASCAARSTATASPSSRAHRAAWRIGLPA